MSNKKVQLINVLAHDEIVISLITFQNQLILATTKNIYAVRGNKLYEIELVQEKDQEDASPEV